ncbi:hypothetical protein HK405_006438 [Cladochytrium tenue]|nr:hypothetical protein HK405_006438 [Cladochytrium tenue]
MRSSTPAQLVAVCAVLTTAATFVSSAATTASPTLDCGSAISILNADLDACASSAAVSTASASSLSADAYYTCVCSGNFLVTDIQQVYNVCPTDAFTNDNGHEIAALYDKCQSLGYSLTPLTNIPAPLASSTSAPASDSATSTTASATTTASPVTDCASAISVLNADLDACASSATFSTASSLAVSTDVYFACVCSGDFLITDVQQVYNVCPAVAFDNDNGQSILALYGKCQSLGYSLAPLTNVPTVTADSTSTSSCATTPASSSVVNPIYSAASTAHAPLPLMLLLASAAAATLLLA